jgi:hypothetical protein
MPVPKKASSGIIAITPISPTHPSIFFSKHHNRIVPPLTANT